MRNTGMFKFISAVVLALALSACGGGGGEEGNDSVSAPTPPAPPTGIISGVAAAGASLPYANISIKDSAGTVTTATADSNGQFILSTNSDEFPYLIKAVSVDGLTIIYTMAFEGDVGSAVAVTPLSSIVVANSFGTDAGTAYDNFSVITGTAAAANRSTAVNNLYTAFAPLANALGVTVASAADLIGVFTPNHTGIDRLLDAINVTTVGTNIVVTDKIGNTILTDSITSNTDVPTATVPADIVATTDQSAGIASYLANLTQYCGKYPDLLSCSSYEPTSVTFIHSNSDNTFLTGAGANPGWLKHYLALNPTNVSVMYTSPIVKFIDAYGTWVKFTVTTVTSGGAVTKYQEAGYFKQESSNWVFVGDRYDATASRTYSAANARIDWKVRTHSINPEIVDFAYVRVTSEAFGEIRLYKNAARWPDEFDNYVSENCVAITNVAVVTTCTSGYTIDGSVYPEGTLLPIMYQFVDTAGNAISGWKGTANIRL